MDCEFSSLFIPHPFSTLNPSPPFCSLLLFQANFPLSRLIVLCSKELLPPCRTPRWLSSISHANDIPSLLMSGHSNYLLMGPLPLFVFESSKKKKNKKNPKKKKKHNLWACQPLDVRFFHFLLRPTHSFGVRAQVTYLRAEWKILDLTPIPVSACGILKRPVTDSGVFMGSWSNRLGCAFLNASSLFLITVARSLLMLPRSSPALFPCFQRPRLTKFPSSFFSSTFPSHTRRTLSLGLEISALPVLIFVVRRLSSCVCPM